MYTSNPGRVPIKEAAQLLDKSTDTIRRMLRDGRLRGEMVEGIWMVEVPEAAPPQMTGMVSAQYVVEVLDRELQRRADELDRLRSLLTAQAAEATQPKVPWYRRIFGVTP